MNMNNHIYCNSIIYWFYWFLSWLWYNELSWSKDNVFYNGKYYSYDWLSHEVIPSGVREISMSDFIDFYEANDNKVLPDWLSDYEKSLKHIWTLKNGINTVFDNKWIEYSISGIVLSFDNIELTQEQVNNRVKRFGWRIA